MDSQNSVLGGPLESLFMGFHHQAYIQLGSLVSISLLILGIASLFGLFY